MRGDSKPKPETGSFTNEFRNSLYIKSQRKKEKKEQAAYGCHYCSCRMEKEFFVHKEITVLQRYI
jgi:hypothetical protein